MRERIAYATLVGLVAYAAIATDLYLPAIPVIVDAFNATESHGQITLSVFMLGLAGGQLVFGPLSDYYGRIPVVTAGTILFTATSIACALADSMPMMWAARALQGFAASSGPVIARAIVRDKYHGNRAASVMSMLGAAMAVIPLIAPTIGSWVLVLINWQATFLVLALFSLLVLAGLRQFDESAPQIGVGTIGILRVLRLFGTCLANRRFIGYQIAGTSSFAVIMAYLSTVSFFMRDVFNLAPEYFGYAFALSVSGFMSGALICSKLVVRFGLNRTLTAGALITLCATALQLPLSYAAARSGAPAIIEIAMLSFTVFFGIGLTSANAAMGAVSLFPQSAGAASAVYGFLHAITSASVGYIAGVFYDGTLVVPAVVMFLSALAGAAALPLAVRHNNDDGAALGAEP